MTFQFLKAPPAMRIEPPTSPYARAKSEWDSRMGSVTVQGANWRLMAFGCLAALMVSLGGNIFQAYESQVQLYVAQIDPSGELRQLRLAGDIYEPTKAQISYYLAQWIMKVRSKPTDAVVLRQNWQAAYKFLTQQASVTLNQWAQEHDPFKDVGKVARTAEVVSVIQRTENTYQVTWRESLYKRGVITQREKYSALFTITIKAPGTEQEIFNNPLGIYIEAFNWSQEF